MYDKRNLLLYLKVRDAYYTLEKSIYFNRAMCNTIKERYEQL